MDTEATVEELDKHSIDTVCKLTKTNCINSLENYFQQNLSLNTDSLKSQASTLINQFYPSEEKIISQLFEESVLKYGERTAVCFQSESISYSELNEKTNRLANYLRKFGVSRNSIVAIFLEPSIEFIISILAIVKAGGVFLTLNTDDPDNRIRRILQDSGPVKIITSSDLRDSIMSALPLSSEDNIIKVNLFFDERIPFDDNNPAYVNEPEDLLYVMYTSGSTGNPKGCMVPHRCVARVVKNTNYIQIDPSDIIAQVANVAFDVLIFEMFGALFNGACLHIIPQITLLSPTDFSRVLKQNHITILCLTASLLNLLVKSCPDAFDNLKYLLSTGERANPQIIKLLLTRKLKYHLPLKVVNAYGPTECTTFATAFLVNDISDIEKNVPIGKPITDTTTYVLNENLQALPAGALGELYLGGKGVALGYLNDSRQTANKFIINPFNPAEKLYKTGDIVYWQPDLGLVYVDRVDAQIKINGFRVEPSEIESTIIKNRSVKQVAVVVQMDKQDRKKLVVYVSFEQKRNEVNYDKFQQYLKDNIPHYMMPSETIQVDHIPLTISGKVDKIALVKMQGKNILESNVHNIPSNRVEKILIEVWQRLLSIASINVSQNFFDLGAHSLMLNEACNIINFKLSNNISKAIDIMDIFNYPSIEKLAKFINEREKNCEDFLTSSISRTSYQRQRLMNRNASKCIRR